MSKVFTASPDHRYSQTVLEILTRKYDATSVSPHGKVPRGVTVLWQTRSGCPSKFPDHITVIELSCDKTAEAQAIEIADNLGLEKR